LTGFTYLLSELAGKRLEFLREVMPRLSRVAVVWNPDHPDPDFKDTQVAASRLGIRLQSIEVRKLDDIEAALATATRDHAEAIIVVTSRLTLLRQSQILDFAAKNRIPIATGFGTWVQTGALLSYGPDTDEIVRKSVSHVDKILKGAKPGDIPIEQPTRFQLTISLKTARTLNLTVPQSLLARADRVIE
jgi:putative ABC transport system substrate-binding protein